MKLFLTQKNATFVFHNGVMFDKVYLQKILDIKIEAKIIDTLALSWYLYPKRDRHGLEFWGEDFGVPKPKITDWVNLSIEEYCHRCEEDVKITWKLWWKEKSYLKVLYNTEDVENLPIISYLTFKLECAALAKESKIKLDLELAKSTLALLEKHKEEKVKVLQEVMPKVKKWDIKNKPAKLYKKNGDLSEAGKNWYEFLEKQGLPNTHSFPVKYIKSEEIPNPSSTPQIKDWLFSLGWEPIRFETNKTNGNDVPQIKMNKQDPDLCPSVVALADKEPGILELEGLSIIDHRLGLIKGFLSSVSKDGYLEADIQGFTNTLRFKHRKPIVNLPGVDKPYGKEIRSCLIAREGYVFIGSDVVSLEDSTKKHYIYPYDPEYVKDMSAPDYDPHLDLAVNNQVITHREMEDHKKGVINLSKIRKIYKVVNYSSVYGIGAPKLAKDLKITLLEAKKLLKAYWKRNWSVKKVSEDFIVKRVGDQDWLFNPVSKFYYSLRAEKDKFSTANQGTGVYVFDNWVREVLKRRNQLTFQMHDEILLEVKKNEVDDVLPTLEDAMKAVNNKLKLNVEIKVDSKDGSNYAECH